jgi:DNA repair protein RecO (recombination protein O)
MHLRLPAILCAVRAHGETGAVIRLLTADHGLLAAYCAGARGRRLRPVLIPGNMLDAQVSARSASQLPFAKVELVESRGPWLGEPLASAGINWGCALTASALPEGHPYPALYQALGGLLDAICQAPSARGWSRALAAYEALLLRELGYGGSGGDPGDDWATILDRLQHLGEALETRLLAERGVAGRRGDVMAARAILIERLKRIAGDG